MKTKVYLFSTSSHPDAISINSLKIVFFKPDIDFSKYDYFIITSKQAVKALQEYTTSAYIKKPGLCISKQSALAYENIGGSILELGRGYGDTLFELIEKYPKDTKWLYLRAKEVASDFVQRSKATGYMIDQEILYKSFCSEDISDVKVESKDTLIFTSPSSIKCFIKNKTIYPTNNVIVIGKTTASFLPSNIKYKIAEKNTIQSCIDLI